MGSMSERSIRYPPWLSPRGRTGCGSARPLRGGYQYPAVFLDYQNTPYDFEHLHTLGHFFLPSRVVQYAAVGLPVVTVGLKEGSAHFPSTIPALDGEDALARLEGVLSSAHVRNELKALGQREVRSHFSGLARARFLEVLLCGELEGAHLGLHEREFAYRWWDGSNVDAAISASKSA